MRSVGSGALPGGRLLSLVAVMALVLGSLALGACSRGIHPTLFIDASVDFERRLIVGDLALGYPDDMHVVDEAEDGAMPYADATLGYAPVAASKAISKKNVVFVLEVAETNSTKALPDIETDYEGLMRTLGDAGGDEHKWPRRLSLDKTEAVVNGMPCVIVETVLQRSPEMGGAYIRGIAYVLLGEHGNIIGQVRGLFYEDAYIENPGLYDSIFASVTDLNKASD